MRRSMTRTALTAALVAMLGVAAACGSSGGSSSDKSLTVWIMEGTNADEHQYFNKIGREFTKANPGSSVDVQFVPWTAAHDKIDKVMTGNPGEGPDVIEMGTTWNAEFASAGGLADLTDRVNSWKLKDAQVPGTWESTQFDGKYYGVPWYAGVRSLVYRKDWFAKLGITPPQTWADLVSAGKKIQQAMPNVYAFGVPGNYEYALYPFIWSAGGNIATKQNGTWQGGLTSPAAREGIAFYTGLLTQHHFSPPGAATWDATTVVKNLEIGKLAMAPAGEWEIATIYQDKPSLKGKLGSVEFPTKSAGQPSQSFLGGSNLVIPATSDSQDLAWSYITMLDDPANQQQWAEDTRFFPTNKSILDQASWAKEPIMSAFIQQFETGRNVPNAPQWGKVQGDLVIPSMVQTILTGKASVAEATAKANQTIEDDLNQSSG